jgi:hypothetical protein
MKENIHCFHVIHKVPFDVLVVVLLSLSLGRNVAALDSDVAFVDFKSWARRYLWA